MFFQVVFSIIIIAIIIIFKNWNQVYEEFLKFKDRSLAYISENYEKYSNISIKSNSEKEIDKVPKLLSESEIKLYLNYILLSLETCPKLVQRINDLGDHYKSIKPLLLLKNLMSLLNKNNNYNIKDVLNNTYFLRWNNIRDQNIFQIINLVFGDILLSINDHSKALSDYSEKFTGVDVSLPFEFILNRRFLCQSCGNEQIENEFLMIFKLKIPFKLEKNIIDLQTLFNNNIFKESNYKSFICQMNNCSGIRKITSTINNPLPQILILQIDNLYWNGKSVKKSKETIQLNMNIVLETTFQNQNNINVDNPKDSLINDTNKDRIKIENGIKECEKENFDTENTDLKVENNFKKLKDQTYHLKSILLSHSYDDIVLYKLFNTIWYKMYNDKSLEINVEELLKLPLSSALLFYDIDKW